MQHTNAGQEGRLTHERLNKLSLLKHCRPRPLHEEACSGKVVRESSAYDTTDSTLLLFLCRILLPCNLQKPCWISMQCALKSVTPASSPALTIFRVGMVAHQVQKSLVEAAGVAVDVLP